MENNLTYTTSKNLDSKNDGVDQQQSNVAGDVKVTKLKQSFSIWSVLGVGFGLTNSWFGISASLVTGISSGGPLLIVYGIIIVAAISTCIGVTLSELSSAYPNSGGQYYWTTKLGGRRFGPFLSYMCGSLSVAGAIFTSASTNLSSAAILVGFYAMGREDFVVKKWMVFVCFECLTVFTFCFNCYGRILPHVAKVALYTSLFSFGVITITVLACSSGNYNSAHFVFAEFNNATGWKSAGIAFIVGLINPNWAFSCLDSATHLAEEVAQPERIIPISIMGTVAIGFITSFCYSISMFFSIRNLSEILSSNTGVPILDIYYQSLQSRAGALCLGTLVFLTGLGCNISCHTWQARLVWSFSRDRGLPGHKHWAKIHPTLGVPLNAHIMACVLVLILGCLYMASDTAFNSMVTGCIEFLLLSYVVPTVCLLYRGRDSIKHGPFWLGKIGLFANVVLIAWTIFTMIFFCFPFTMPVTKDNMNYASVVIFGYVLYCVIYWKVQGKKTFITHEEMMERDSIKEDVTSTDESLVFP